MIANPDPMNPSWISQHPLMAVCIVLAFVAIPFLVPDFFRRFLDHD